VAGSANCTGAAAGSGDQIRSSVLAIAVSYFAVSANAFFASFQRVSRDSPPLFSANSSVSAS
jgi:hypothetical protein